MLEELGKEEADSSHTADVSVNTPPELKQGLSRRTDRALVPERADLGKGHSCPLTACLLQTTRARSDSSRESRNSSGEHDFITGNCSGLTSSSKKFVST